VRDVLSTTFFIDACSLAGAHGGLRPSLGRYQHTGKSKLNRFIFIFNHCRLYISFFVCFLLALLLLLFLLIGALLSLLAAATAAGEFFSRLPLAQPFGFSCHF
jgi:hypothetical protein